MTTARAEIGDEVLDLARQGDSEAWATIVRTVGPRLRGYALGRGAPDPDDVMQEVFMAAAERLGGFVGDARAFRSWLFAIAYRKVVDRYRRSGREEPGLPRVMVASGEAGPEETVIDRIDSRAAVDALEVLSEMERDVILMRVVAGLDTRDVAEAVGKSAGNVRVIQSRAVAKLRRVMAGGTRRGGGGR